MLEVFYDFAAFLICRASRQNSAESLFTVLVTKQRKSAGFLFEINTQTQTEMNDFVFSAASYRMQDFLFATVFLLWMSSHKPFFQPLLFNDISVFMN